MLQWAKVPNIIFDQFEKDEEIWVIFNHFEHCLSQSLYHFVSAKSESKEIQQIHHKPFYENIIDSEQNVL